MNVGLWNAIDWSCCACSPFQSCKICCNNLCSEKCQNLLHWINIKLSLCSLWSCDHGGIFEALQAVIVWCEGQFVCRSRSHICQTLPFFGVSSHLYMRTSRWKFGSLVSMHTCMYLWNACHFCLKHDIHGDSLIFGFSRKWPDKKDWHLWYFKRFDWFLVLNIHFFFPASIY